jgi:pyruvate ferredoxin oxidoreductase gamma subunit
MIEVRFHGRGGQGAKIASRMLGRSALLAGLYAQDFALLGDNREKRRLEANLAAEPQARLRTTSLTDG